MPAEIPEGVPYELPAIGRPATSALVTAGLTSLDKVAELTEKQLLGMHGVGPKAVRILREALVERGSHFAG